MKKSKIVFRAALGENSPLMEKELTKDNLQPDGKRKLKTNKELDIECLRLCLGLKTKFPHLFAGGGIFELHDGQEKPLLVLNADLREVKEEKEEAPKNGAAEQPSI